MKVTWEQRGTDAPLPRIEWAELEIRDLIKSTTEKLLIFLGLEENELFGKQANINPLSPRSIQKMNCDG